MDGIVCSLIIGFLLVVGLYNTKQVQSESTYLFANRKLSWFPLTATLVMTEFNSATLIAFSSLGYAAGFRALQLPFIFLIGLVFYAIAVAKKWKEYDGISVGGFFRKQYGATIGKVSSFLLLVAMIGFSAVYVKSLALIFVPMFPMLNHWIVSGGFVVLILIMTLRGGLISVVRTDVLSFLLALFFFPLIALIMWKSSSVAGLSFLSQGETRQFLPPRFVLSLVILTMFTYILAPWYGQKMFAAKSKKIAFWAVFFSAIFVFILYSSAILATAYFRYTNFPVTTNQEALPNVIYFFLPTGIKGLGYALLFASSATTLTGVWNAMTAMWKADFLQSSLLDQKCDQSIGVTAIFAFISYILANTLVDRVLDHMILANIPVAALAFGLLAGFYWKKVTRFGVILSIVTGCICGLTFYLYYGEQGLYTWYWALYGIPLSFLSGFLGSIRQVFKKKMIISTK